MKKLIIVSGRSGSGKSIALSVLEDLGYYCVDNLPLSLLSILFKTLADDYHQVAVSLDVRNLPKDPNELEETLQFLPEEIDFDIIFLNAKREVLLRRYSETRRLHPLSQNTLPLVDALDKESDILHAIRQQADFSLDTSHLSIHELSERIKERALGEKVNTLVLSFESFGFKYGIPSDVDYMFDARFLPNPYWIAELKSLTGRDQAVINYLGSQEIVNKFIFQIKNFFETWLPHIERMNRSYLTIAIGCTGGQHRSVYATAQLAQYFLDKYPDLQIRHRELPND